MLLNHPKSSAYKNYMYCEHFTIEHLAATSVSHSRDTEAVYSEIYWHNPCPITERKFQLPSQGYIKHSVQSFSTLAIFDS